MNSFRDAVLGGGCIFDDVPTILEKCGGFGGTEVVELFELVAKVQHM